MDRIDHPTATEERQFTGGNPSAGVPPTRVTADFLNDLQEELCRLIEAQGITLDPANQDQLAQAILAMIVGEMATLTIADISGLQAALDAKAAASHTHAIADTTGLQTALDGKAAASHTHTTAQVTGLDTALAGKLGTTAQAADSALLGGSGSATSATANSIAKRDASGNLTANLFSGTATSARYA